MSDHEPTRQLPAAQDVPATEGVPPGHAPVAPAHRPTNGMAVAALVCGLVALVLCVIPFVNVLSVLAGVTAVVLGVLGLRGARRRQGSGKGMSIAGLATGAVGTVVAVVVLVAAVSTMRQVAAQANDLQNLFSELEGLGGGAPGEPGEGLTGLEGLVEGLGDLTLPEVTPPDPATTVDVGEPVTDGDLEFVVTGYESAGTTFGEGAGAEQADGEFVLVHLTVRNTGATQAFFAGTLQLLRDDQGTHHTVDLQTLFGVPDANLTSTIEPGATSEGVLVYDVPAGATPDQVVLSGTMLTSTVAVRLP